MYDANQSYLKNYEDGPNSKFISGHKFPHVQYQGEPKFSFLGIPLFIPFGVPAGPLLNAKFVRVALNAGFCLPTYKTVRSCAWESHPWPNVLKIESKNGRVVGHPFTQNDYTQKNLSISNSFGVPSQTPDVWMDDFQTLKPYSEHKGFHVVLSFQGSHTKQGFFDDIVEVAHYAVESVENTGFCLLEINLSCPNEANEPIYKSRKDAVHALKSANQILSKHKNIKLIAKIGAMNAEDTYAFLSEVSPYAQGLSAINTMPANIEDERGGIVLGSGSRTGGVCGASILQQGLLMCENLAEAREKCGLKSKDFGLIGVGGVSEVTHFQHYLNAGADVVQAATGMMWNLKLASEIANALHVPFSLDFSSKSN